MEGISATVLGRVGRPAEAPASFLAQALRDDPALAEDPIFVENLAYFLHIARCDLVGLCGWLVRMMADHPDHVWRIAAARKGTAGGAGAAIDFAADCIR